MLRHMNLAQGDFRDIKKSKLNKDEIDEVVLGQVLTGGTGQNPARQAAMHKFQR